MFGSNFAENFGLPGFPWTGMDAAGGMFGPTFSAMETGQPVPGAGLTPGGPAEAQPAPGAGLGQSANPSVAALQSGNPLAAANAGQAGPVGHIGADPLAQDTLSFARGAGSPPAPLNMPLMAGAGRG